MISLKEYKEPQHHLKAESFLSPQRLYLPLAQHTGKPSRPIVELGQEVEEGQVLALEEGFISSRLHSPCKGRIVAIQRTRHHLLGESLSLVIDCLPQEKHYPLKKDIDIERLSKEELLKKIKESGIVGLGGAAFPTHVKLTPPKKIETLIINGCECEPYLASDCRLMVEKPAEILKGIQIIAKIITPGKILFALEDNKEEAIKNIQFWIKSFKLPITLRVLKTLYPQGGERQLIYSLTKRIVPSGALPFSVGCLVQNVATCFAIYEAVYLNKPLISRLVTFAGDALESPQNLWVKIGTPLRELFEKEILRFKSQPKKIICGGPMMGVALDGLDYPILKGTGGFLFLEKGVVLKEELNCIRCARCVRHCPMRLMPCLLDLYSRKGLQEELKNLGVSSCIECGICSYVCPAQRSLVQTIKYAKMQLIK